jgi:hypothetical protein
VTGQAELSAHAAGPAMPCMLHGVCAAQPHPPPGPAASAAVIAVAADSYLAAPHCMGRTLHVIPGDLVDNVRLHLRPQVTFVASALPHSCLLHEPHQLLGRRQQGRREVGARTLYPAVVSAAAAAAGAPCARPPAVASGQRHLGAALQPAGMQQHAARDLSTCTGTCVAELVNPAADA